MAIHGPEQWVLFSLFQRQRPQRPSVYPVAFSRRKRTGQIRDLFRGQQAKRGGAVTRYGSPRYAFPTPSGLRLKAAYVTARSRAGSLVVTALLPTAVAHHAIISNDLEKSQGAEEKRLLVEPTFDQAFLVTGEETDEPFLRSLLSPTVREMLKSLPSVDIHFMKREAVVTAHALPSTEEQLTVILDAAALIFETSRSIR